MLEIWWALTLKALTLLTMKEIHTLKTQREREWKGKRRELIILYYSFTLLLTIDKCLALYIASKHSHNIHYLYYIASQSLSCIHFINSQIHNSSDQSGQYRTEESFSLVKEMKYFVTGIPFWDYHYIYIYIYKYFVTGVPFWNYHYICIYI